jgi:dephospho-CoA kinase
MPCRLVVGLTGGVASGKTAASELFSRLGVPVIDTDIIARKVVKPGQPAIGQIEQAFGPSVITPTGGVDRARLRRRIFADPTLRTALEQILHPRIRALAEQQIRALEAPYCVVVVPLLIESGMLDLVNRVLVIDIPESEQIARVQTRDNISREDAERMLKAQASRSQRLTHADDVIVNDGSRDELRMAVEKLHRQYLLHSRNDSLS